MIAAHIATAHAAVRDLGRLRSSTIVRVGILFRYRSESELRDLVRLQTMRSSPLFKHYLTRAQWNAPGGLSHRTRRRQPRLRARRRTRRRGRAHLRDRNAFGRTRRPDRLPQRAARTHSREHDCGRADFRPRYVHAGAAPAAPHRAVACERAVRRACERIATSGIDCDARAQPVARTDARRRQFDRARRQYGIRARGVRRRIRLPGHARLRRPRSRDRDGRFGRRRRERSGRLRERVLAEVYGHGAPHLDRRRPADPGRSRYAGRSRSDARRRSLARARSGRRSLRLRNRRPLRLFDRGRVQSDRFRRRCRRRFVEFHQLREFRFRDRIRRRLSRDAGRGQGHHFTASTGDDNGLACYIYVDEAGVGANVFASVGVPAADQYFTAVDGSDLVVDVSTGTYVAETGYENGSGGTSIFEPLPAWQASTSGVAAGGRNVPDVALDAGNATGFDVYFHGTTVPTGGTSLSSPLMAAMVAEIDEVEGTRNGWINPRLYQIFNAQSYGFAFRDITAGTDGLYTATAGYDRESGIGSVRAWELAGEL